MEEIPIIFTKKMMHPCTFSFTALSFLPFLLFGQKISRAQFEAFADSLRKREILSDSGQNYLLHFPEKEARVVTPYLGGDKDSSYVSGLLGKCGLIFYNELNHRCGMVLDFDYHQNHPHVSESQMKKEIKKWVKLFPYLEIEDSIVAEDSLTNIGFTSWGPPYALPVGLVHAKRSTFGKHLTRTRNELLQMSLINEQLYQEALVEQKKEEIRREADLFLFLSKRAYYYENFASEKAKQLLFIDNLKKAGLLTEEGYKTLLNSYQAYELKSKFDMIKYCQDVLVLDKTQYTKDPKALYTKLFEEAKGLLPAFGYQELKIEVKEEKNYDPNTVDRDVMISFKASGNQYSSTFYHDFIRLKPEEWDSPEPYTSISEGFINGINKWLADEDSDKRLYFVNDRNEHSVFDNQHFGLILMTKAQYEAWKSNGSDYFIPEQNHDNFFNSKKIDALLSEYEKLGLFSHLTKEEYAKGLQNTKVRMINSYLDILECFPKTVVEIEWEDAIMEHPYEELTSQLKEISRGAFTPIKIKDQFWKSLNRKKSQTTFSFVLKDKRYETQLKMNVDWLDPSFLDLIDKSTDEQKLGGKFYECYPTSSSSHYLFLSKQQHDFLQEHQPSLLNIPKEE
jgi:hypothetical protein